MGAERPISDPLALDILWSRMTAMVSEQAAALQRTAFSPLVKEAGDLSVGIFDVRGQLVVQAVTGTPGHIFALPASVRTLLERFGWEDLGPGDVLLTNDPFIGCGHQFDMTVVTPIFDGHEPFAVYASTCHVLDIGGVPSGDGRDLHEEGLIIPPVKLRVGGEARADVRAFIESNVRRPEEVMGDLNSLVGANDVGGSRLISHMRELGQQRFQDCADQIIERTEAAMRAAISDVPDGVYDATVRADGAGDLDSIEICVQISIGGDEVSVDFEGTSPASSHAINVALNYTNAYASFALKCALCPQAPNNEGSMRPVEVKAPRGSLLNAVPPSPVSMRHIVGHVIPGAIFKALAKAAPDRVVAESSGGVWMTTLISGGNGGIVSWINSGGMGARPTKDGLTCTAFPAGTSSVPIEILESGGEIVVHRREITMDSGGPGRYRGGCGQTLEVEMRGRSNWIMSCSTDRVHHPAAGAAGGRPGGAGALLMSGKPLELRRQNAVPRGGVFVMELPGGGGFGDPYTRAIEDVERDVVAGVVSRASAAQDYGVVFVNGELGADREASERLRGRVRVDE